MADIHGWPKQILEGLKGAMRWYRDTDLVSILAFVQPSSVSWVWWRCSVWKYMYTIHQTGMLKGMLKGTDRGSNWRRTTGSKYSVNEDRTSRIEKRDPQKVVVTIDFPLCTPESFWIWFLFHQHILHIYPRCAHTAHLCTDCSLGATEMTQWLRVITCARCCSKGPKFGS